jgi:hypothetical protein
MVRETGSSGIEGASGWRAIIPADGCDGSS